ncbi:hypothetical protein L3V82_07535 [Thiotrichales bacterium 19S3-7]|nr:hypothetical protein [Thiotrichales bacterium 19S3-7]MCF6802009.1 hypothetical protein [Thiotrichales bacterium 19S3-11]
MPRNPRKKHVIAETIKTGVSDLKSQAAKDIEFLEVLREMALNDQFSRSFTENYNNAFSSSVKSMFADMFRDPRHPIIGCSSPLEMINMLIEQIEANSKARGGFSDVFLGRSALSHLKSFFIENVICKSPQAYDYLIDRALLSDNNQAMVSLYESWQSTYNRYMKSDRDSNRIIPGLSHRFESARESFTTLANVKMLESQIKQAILHTALVYYDALKQDTFRSSKVAAEKFGDYVDFESRTLKDSISSKNLEQLISLINDEITVKLESQRGSSSVSQQELYENLEQIASGSHGGLIIERVDSKSSRNYNFQLNHSFDISNAIENVRSLQQDINSLIDWNNSRLEFLEKREKVYLALCHRWERTKGKIGGFFTSDELSTERLKLLDEAIYKLQAARNTSEVNTIIHNLTEANNTLNSNYKLSKKGGLAKLLETYDDGAILGDSWNVDESIKAKNIGKLKEVEFVSSQSLDRDDISSFDIDESDMKVPDTGDFDSLVVSRAKPSHFKLPFYSQSSGSGHDMRTQYHREALSIHKLCHSIEAKSNVVDEAFRNFRKWDGELQSTSRKALSDPKTHGEYLSTCTTMTKQAQTRLQKNIMSLRDELNQLKIEAPTAKNINILLSRLDDTISKFSVKSVDYKSVSLLVSDVIKEARFVKQENPLMSQESRFTGPLPEIDVSDSALELD